MLHHKPLLSSRVARRMQPIMAQASNGSQAGLSCVMCLHLVKSLRAAGRNSLTMRAAPLRGEHASYFASTRAMPAHHPDLTNKIMPRRLGPLKPKMGVLQGAAKGDTRNAHMPHV